MRSSILIRSTTFAALLATPLGAQSALGHATSKPTPQDKAAPPISEWTVPFGDRTRPRDPFVAPDGRIWFVGQVGNYLAVFDPKSAEFKKYALEDRALPHTNIVAPDGIVWYAGNGNGSIGRLDPKTGEIKIIRMPAGVRDPHTLVLDGKGGMWFTAQNSNFVGHLTLATEQVRMVAMPTAGTRPYGIIVDNTGRPYFDLFGTNQLGTIDPVSMELKTFALPEGARPRRIGRTNDGAIWYVDYSRGFLGRLDPKTSKVEEWPNPSGPASLPYAMTVDDADRIWYVETGIQPNRLVAFDSKTKQVVHNAAINGGTGANTVRHMVFDPKTRTIWFGGDNNMLGMVKVPPKPAM
jgi:virginiamycin B lyase